MYRKMRKSSVVVLVTHTLFIIWIGLLLLLSGSYLSLSSLQYILIIIFAENILISLSGPFFNLYQIFLGTSFLFTYARIFLDALGYCDFRIQNLPGGGGYLSENEARELLIVLILFLIATSLAGLLYLIHSRELNEKSKKYFDSQSYSKVTHILQWVYYFLICMCIIKTGIVIREVLRNGYRWLFDGGIQAYPFPFFLRVQTLTSVVFPILLFYDRRPKIVLRNILLYMFYLGIRLFTGQRGATFVSLLLLMWIYSTYYKKIRVSTVALIGTASLFIIQFIRFFRGTATAGDSGNVLYAALYSQGVSVLVVANVIRLIDELPNKYPFVIGYFVDFFSEIFNPEMRKGQNMERILHGNYLGDHLIYAFSPERYLSGSGTGTSIIAELYEFVNGNLFFFSMISFLFMLIILFAAHKLYKNVFYFVFLYHILYYFIYSPRDSVFKSFNIIMLSLPVVIVFKLIERKKLGGIQSLGKGKDTITSPYQGECTHLAK